MTVPSSTFKVDEIENSNATEDTGGQYEIDAISGFKQKAGTLVQTWNGIWTRPESYDPKHPQLMVRSQPETHHGAQRPEAQDTFISTTVSAESL